ncbi:MAG: DUF3784 domain-containing protein [Candidatus Methanomethylophilaceae archaeon]
MASEIGIMTVLISTAAPGIMFLLGKGDMLLAGWNTMSEEGRSEFDRERFSTRRVRC